MGEIFRLEYELAPDNDINVEEYKKAVKILNDVGIFIYSNNNRLILSCQDNKYRATKTRGAGRHVKYVRFNTDFSKKEPFSDENIVRFSDFALLIQSKKDVEICNLIGDYEICEDGTNRFVSIPSASYYRKKKKFMESLYYKSIDKDRFNDVEYLKSIKGNYKL